MNKLRFVNSTVAFILAGLTAVTLHELAHFVAALVLGEPAILYPNGVDTGEAVSKAHALVIALAGPLFSIVFGFAIMRFAQTWGRGLTNLFWLWLGFLSAQIGFGYLIVAPFFKAGDTGRALALVGASVIVYILVFALGVAGQTWLAKLFGARIAAFSADEKASRSIGLYPWMAGTVTLLLVYMFAIQALPAEAVTAVLAGIATIGIFVSMLTIFTKNHTYNTQTLANLSVPYVAIGVAVAFALTLILVVSRGLSLD